MKHLKLKYRCSYVTVSYSILEDTICYVDVRRVSCVHNTLSEVCMQRLC